jgi:hypothetical protein
MRRPKDPLPGLWRREGLTPDLFPLGFSLGGGWVARPAADTSQATGRVKRGATTSFTAPAFGVRLNHLFGSGSARLGLGFDRVT